MTTSDAHVLWDTLVLDVRVTLMNVPLIPAKVEATARQVDRNYYIRLNTATKNHTCSASYISDMF